jgi:hypothetical protein
MDAAGTVAALGTADRIDVAVVVAALDLDIAGDVVVLAALDAPVGIVVANEPSVVGDVVAVAHGYIVVGDAVVACVDVFVVVDDVVVVGVARGLAADHNC